MVELSCIILAGGKSERMNKDKKEIKISGKTFLDIALEKARKISDDIILSLGVQDRVEGPYENVTVAVDEEGERGPLFALVTSLKKCRNPYVALLPIDAPLLEPEIYFQMCGVLENDMNLEGVVPKSPQGTEPLFGIYLVSSFLKSCSDAVSRGFKRAIDGVNLLDKVEFIGPQEFRGVDPDLLSFYNVNTPQDLEFLERRIK